MFPTVRGAASTLKPPATAKTAEESTGKASDFTFRAKKPDLDNLVKTFLDGLEGLVFESDASIVAFESISKVEGPEAQIYIELSWSRDKTLPCSFEGPGARYSTRSFK